MNSTYADGTAILVSGMTQQEQALSTLCAWLLSLRTKLCGLQVTLGVGVHVPQKLGPPGASFLSFLPGQIPSCFLLSLHTSCLLPAPFLVASSVPYDVCLTTDQETQGHVTMNTLKSNQNKLYSFKLTFSISVTDKN